MVAIVIIVVLLGTSWLYRTAKRKRGAQLAEQWEGVVVEKMPAAGGTQTRQYVSIKTPAGRQMFVLISTELAQTLKVGDKLVKRAGSYEPAKDDSTNTA